MFFVIAAAAPLTCMLGIIPVAIRLGNGAGVPGAFLAAGLIPLIFRWGCMRCLVFRYGDSHSSGHPGIAIKSPLMDLPMQP